MTQFPHQDGFYDKLHQRWRMINETHSMQEIAQLALDFAVDELGFQQAVLFVHDDATGLFKLGRHFDQLHHMERRNLRKPGGKRKIHDVARVFKAGPKP